MHGSKTWFFPDGDLPLAGDTDPIGHESLIMVNPNDADAEVTMTVFFEEKEPDRVEGISLAASRVRCVRMDQPIGPDGYRVPSGQYALMLESTVPIVCQLGRMDVRQPNLAYYTTMGFPG